MVIYSSSHIGEVDPTFDPLSHSPLDEGVAIVLYIIENR
jgi:hypothetical protein